MERCQQLWAAPETPDDSSDDYLQDPELWLDRLPQPFRMIDGVLQDLLSRTWEAIETRELQRETERTRVRIPQIVAERAVEGARDVRSVQAGRDVVFIGCQDGLRVATAKGGKDVAFSPTDSAVTSLAVEQMDSVQIIAACTGNVCLMLSCNCPAVLLRCVISCRLKHNSSGLHSATIRCQANTASRHIQPSTAAHACSCDQITCISGFPSVYIHRKKREELLQYLSLLHAQI